MQQQLQSVVAPLAWKVDLAAAMPKFDIPRLTAPAYAKVDIEPFSKSLGDAETLGVTDHSLPSDEFLKAIAEDQTERLEEEAEVRRASLETATVVASQLRVLEDLRDVVVESNKRDWYDWLLLILTAVAALCATAAVTATLT